MRKFKIITTLFFICFVSNSYSQFGLKKLKNDVVKNTKTKAVDNAFKKINDLCVGKNKNLTELSPTDKAFTDYQNLKFQITQFEKDLETSDITKLLENANNIKKNIKKIKKLNPNANLSSECKRITALKSKLKI